MAEPPSSMDHPSTNVRQECPSPSGLILTHNLQLEVKSELNPLKKCLQGKPALPDRSPSRRTIVGTCQIASHTCHLHPKSTQRHAHRRVTRTLSQHSKRHRLNQLGCKAFWVLASVGTYLQQAHGKRRQQPQQTYQAVHRLQLPLRGYRIPF